MAKRLDKMTVELRSYDNRTEETDLTSLAGTLRDFLDMEYLSRYNGWDVTGELVAGPEYVLFYAAQYIELLEMELRKGRAQ